MRYVIKELNHLKGSALYYLLVDFFEPDNAPTPSLTEDFLMQLADEGDRIATDKDGNLLLVGGGVIAPDKMEKSGTYEFVWEAFKKDVPGIITSNILKRWDLAVTGNHSGNWTGDASKPALKNGEVISKGSESFELDSLDPKAVLARDDVKALVSNP